MDKVKKQFTKEQFENPFGTHKKGGKKQTNKSEEQKKMAKEQEKIRAHHVKIGKQIEDIFKGKNSLSKEDVIKLKDPKHAHTLFNFDEEPTKATIKASLDKKKKLNAHKLFQGTTSEQRKLKKLIKGKHHIAQTASSGELIGDAEEENDSFSQGEIIEMEENTLKKKIDIDLKVLAKLEAQKNLDSPKFHYKLIKVDEQDQEQEEPK